MMTGRDLIECLRAMTDEERRDVAALLLSPVQERIHWSGDLPGIVANQMFFTNLTEEQRAQVRRSCFCTI